MSFQWTFIVGYLYLEVGIIIVMMLPIASPRRWNQFFNSRLFALYREHAAWYFYILLGVLTLFLMDSIREMRKYSSPSDGNAHLASEMKNHIKLFRAQRNFYITGFAIFLAFVIRRLVNMIIVQAQMMDRSEKIIKEAEAAKDLAKKTVLENQLQPAGDCIDCSSLKSQLESTKTSLTNKVKDLEVEVEMWKQKFNDISVSD